MRILWVSHFLLFPQTGYGALQRSRNLLIELSKRHEVFLVSYYRKNDLELAPDLKAAQADLEKHCSKVVFIQYPLDRYRYARLLITLKSLFSSVPYSAFLYRSKAMSEKISEMINEYNIDLVHSDTMGLFEDILDRSRVIKVLTHHNIESDMMFRRARLERNVFKKWFFYKEAYQLGRYEAAYCHRYDLNIVVSDIDREKLKENDSAIRIAVVENGVDCEYYTHHLRDKDCQGLIFTGTLDWYPNSDAMLYFCREVFGPLQTDSTALTLTIIGKHPPMDLVSLVATNCNIALLGFVPDLREYVRKSRIFVCPIRDGGGTRLKILDAFAQGIPVVSTEIGCEGLHVKNNEHVLIANTPVELVKQINLLLYDEALCNRLSVNGRRFVELNHAFNVLGEKLSKEYERLKPTMGD